MIRSVVFRAYDNVGNVIYAEVRNYKAKTRTGYVRRHANKLMDRLNAKEIRMEFTDDVLDAGVWLDMTSGHTQEVR